MGRRLVAVLHFLLVLVVPLASASHDYGMALSKSILFFEAQRSGYLPKDQRVTWRADSALADGKANGVDLVGGYYDGGDNVKFGLPLAFTITMMSWSILEYGEQLATTGELDHATEALKWGTDYLIKAHPEPNVLYAEVGDGDSDHSCWQRPEDMTTSREAYRIDADHPGSEVAGETAAAMASASMVFRLSNPAYSSDLLNHAKQLFEFADKYRGNYHESIPIVKKYYQSFSGYADELLWAAVWLFHATDDRYYLDYLGNNGDALNGTRSSMIEFSWDVKFVGVQILASKFLLQGKAAHHSRVFKSYQKKAEFFVCSCLGKGSRNIQKTPGGLIFLQGWNNLQYATAASFLLSVYSDYLESAGRNVHCSSGTATPAELLTFAKSQVDYILGDNPSSISYMVGYGSAYPQRIYHRPSSIVSVKVDSTFVSCKGGYAWFGRNASNPNLLDGAVVGGPDAYDDFADDRGNFKQNEPTTYNNAPLIGALARLGGGRSSCSQLLSAAKPFSPITVEQTTVATWNSEGKTYHKYSVKLTNNSTLTAEDLSLNVSKMNVTLRGHKNSSSTYGLPTRLDSLPAGKSFEFVYVNSDSAAHVCITGYTLV